MKHHGICAFFYNNGKAVCLSPLYMINPHFENLDYAFKQNVIEIPIWPIAISKLQEAAVF